MRSKTNNGSNYEQRVSKTIKKIRKTINEEPTRALFCKENDKPIFRLTCTALIDINVITNSGTRRYPFWKWKEGVVVNDKLTNKVTAMNRERIRKYYGASKTAKMPIDIIDEDVVKEVNKSKKKTATTTTTMNEEFFVNKTEEPKFSEPTLSNFSSQELWDELKNRGWQISDGHLCKTEVTVLV